MTDNDRVPTIGEHRGVPLHADQDEERLELVRAQIDRVFALDGQVGALLGWAKRRDMCPESRLLAAALIRAQSEAAAEQRRTRPAVDLDYLAAAVAGLNSAKWRSRTHFDTAIAPQWAPNSTNRPVPRPTPLER